MTPFVGVVEAGLAAGVAVGACADGGGVYELILGQKVELALDRDLAVTGRPPRRPGNVNLFGSDGGERALDVAYLVVVARVKERSCRHALAAPVTPAGLSSWSPCTSWSAGSRARV